MISKIITHEGTFHADELSGVALLLILFPGTPVERTYTPSEADFNDPSVVILDIGRRYEPELNNYDHHQDAGLPASNMLILKHFLVLKEGRLAFLLEKYMFDYISAVDTGKVVENENGKVSPPTISGIIRSMNSLPKNAFNHALDVMFAAVWGQLESATARIKTEDLWEKVEIRGKVAIHDSPEFLVGWQDLAIDQGINYLVTPNLRGGYQVTSRDSKVFPTPPHPTQTFLHNSKFIASYPTLQEAIDHAVSLNF